MKYYQSKNEELEEQLDQFKKVRTALMIELEQLKEQILKNQESLPPEGQERLEQELILKEEELEKYRLDLQSR